MASVAAIDRQQKATTLSAVDGHLDLAATRAVDFDAVRRQPSMSRALRLCIDLSGQPSDKAVRMSLGIDAGQWSRIFAVEGQAHFPHDRLADLMAVCGNDAPLLWLAHRRGYDLHSLRPAESATERELRETREQLAAVQHELQTIKRFVKETTR